jgi:hypothetical protein
MKIQTGDWHGDIACEGGPVLVANLDDFAQWRGSEPLAAAMATELHYWSPFTAELPAEWQPNGPSGHQYLASADPARSREALIALVLERWPGTVVEHSDSVWRATRPDGSVLHAALSPDSEYDGAIRNLDTEGLHRFGSGACAYLWSAAPGLVRVHLDPARDSLLLSQVEFADDEVDAERAYDHALAAWSAPDASGLRYRVTSGPVVVAWSPNSAGDVPQPIRASDAGPSLPGLLLDMSTAQSAALVWLKPGVYASTLGYHDGGSWAVSWCLLSRV